MKRLIVYDLDGTLADTLEDITASANVMLEKMGGIAVSRENVRRSVGRGLRELVKTCLRTEDESRVDEGVRRYREHYGRHMMDHTVVYPGVFDVLEHFRSRTQALITNKPDPFATQMVERLGFSPFFADIIAGDARYPKKPDPASLQALMERFSAEPGQTVYIGDSSIDITTGKRAGVVTVAVSHGFEDREDLAALAPDALVADFHELAELVKARGW